jgi:hypothetical protein
MQATERIASLSAHLSLPEPARAKLCYAVRKAAQRTGISRSVADRYQAWTVAFVSWCHQSPSGHVGPDRIDAFRRALRDRTEMETEAVYEALDALAFFFGAVEEAESLLASIAPPSDSRTAETASRGRPTEEENTDAHTEDRIRSLRIGWQNGTDAPPPPASPARSPSQTTADSSGGTSASGDDPANEDEQEEGASTAEVCIRRYQTQLESLHAATPDAPEASDPPEEGSEAAISPAGSPVPPE